MPSYWIRPPRHVEAEEVEERWKSLLQMLARCANAEKHQWFPDKRCGEFEADNEELAELLLDEHVKKAGGEWGKIGC